MIELQQTTKDGKTFHELTINGTATGRGSYDSDSARLICRNEQNKAQRAEQTAADAAMFERMDMSSNGGSFNITMPQIN